MNQVILSLVALVCSIDFLACQVAAQWHSADWAIDQLNRKPFPNPDVEFFLTKIFPEDRQYKMCSQTIKDILINTELFVIRRSKPELEKRARFCASLKRQAKRNDQACRNVRQFCRENLVAYAMHWIDAIEYRKQNGPAYETSPFLEELAKTVANKNLHKLCEQDAKTPLELLLDNWQASS